MNDVQDQSLQLYDAGRQAMDSGDLPGALQLLEESLALQVHHKTLELIGELRCRLGKHRDAIIPLAAATGLNCGTRAPLLLAEAFLALGDWANAEAAATESLRRDPNCRRARVALDKAQRELSNR